MRTMRIAGRSGAAHSRRRAMQILLSDATDCGRQRSLRSLWAGTRSRRSLPVLVMPEPPRSSATPLRGCATPSDRGGVHSADGVVAPPDPRSAPTRRCGCGASPGACAAGKAIADLRRSMASLHRPATESVRPAVPGAASPSPAAISGGDRARQDGGGAPPERSRAGPAAGSFVSSHQRDGSPCGASAC
jgi:hypothetical protein